MKKIIGLLITLYRKTPLYPNFGQFLASALNRVLRLVKGDMFVHDLGAFRINIDLEQRIDTKVYFTGQWEPETISTINQLLPEGGVAVDVGANIGYLTLLMAAKVTTSGKVMGFEPTTWTYERLEANVALNDMPQIELCKAGLSDAVELCEPADIPYGYRLDGKIVTTRQAINLITLDSYIAEHPITRLDFIKCDTDGNEERVFLGARQTLETFRPALHFELYQEETRENSESSERLLAYLEGLGYGFFREGDLSPFDGAQAVIAELKPLKQCVNVVAIWEGADSTQ